MRVGSWGCDIRDHAPKDKFSTKLINQQGTETVSLCKLDFLGDGRDLQFAQTDCQKYINHAVILQRLALGR